MKSIEEIASNPEKWEKLDAHKKEDFFNMTRKYDIRVKTVEDIEEEKYESVAADLPDVPRSQNE